MAEPRTGFAPVVLLGLGSAGLAALAGNKPWLSSKAVPDLAALDAVQASADRFPLAGAVALLLLATWGVLLVTRRIVRRVLSGLAVVEAIGLISCAVLGPEVVRTQVAKSGTATAHTGPWFWTFAVASVLALVASVLAARLVSRWPEMGTRYDAPTAERAPERIVDVAPEGDAGHRELWRAIDEGHDPTDR